MKQTEQAKQTEPVKQVKKAKSEGWMELRRNAPSLAKTGAQKAGRWFRGNFAMEPRKAFDVLKNGLVTQNPTLVLLLGMCSTLAVTTSLKNSVGMGLSTTAVLVLSNLVISLLRRRIPNQIRIASYVVVVAAFVTSIDLLLQAYLPALSEGLGIFIPLIVVNCIILARAEAFASKHTPGYAALDGLAMGLGFTLALSLLGAIREILGAGKLWGIPLFGSRFQPVLLLVAPCGGFIILGCLIALVQWIRNENGERGGRKA